MLEVKLSKRLTSRDSSFTLNAEFACREGITVLFGPSGAGKTLTLNCIAGLEVPDEGVIRVNGEAYFDSEKNINISPQKRKAGYVFQNYALFPHLTVEENILFGLNSKQNSKERLKNPLQFFEIEGLENRYPHQLSGGQKQRVAIARALIPQPRILLMDEPFSSLDFAVRSRLRRDLKKLREMISIPIVMITHNPVEAYTMAETLIVYSSGRVKQIGSPQEVFTKPGSVDVARLVGVNNIFKGEVYALREHEVLIHSQGDIVAAPDISDLKIGDEITWCIRPDQVMVVREDRPLRKAVAENLFSGKIIDIVPKGASYLIFIEGTFNLEIELPAHAFERLRPVAGKNIRLSLKKSAIHIIRSG